MSPLLNVRKGTWRDAAGSCLAGYIDGSLTVEQITEAIGFGPIGPSGDGKVQHEWVCVTPVGTFTVYDYKGHRWHIGGSLGAASILPWPIERA